MDDKKRKIAVLIGSRSDLKHIRSGINALRIAKMRGLIDWDRLDICSAHRNPEELRTLLATYSNIGIDAIIAVAGKLAALFGDVDAHLRNVLGITETRVIAVPLKGNTERSSLAALYSVLEVPNHKLIFKDEFFHDPTTAFDYAIKGDLPEIELEVQKPREYLNAAEAYEESRIKHPPKASSAPLIRQLEEAGLFHLYTGKTRETFMNPEFPDLLYIFATDRISIFDIVLDTLIPGKGKNLTDTTVFWLTEIFKDVPNHLVAFGEGILPYLPEKLAEKRPIFLMENMLVVKCTKVLKVEAIVRGYLTGSGYKDYKKTGMVCGISLPAPLSGFVDGSKLPTSIFTPSTKADYGLHDENITFEQACDIIGADNARAIRSLSLDLYKRASDLARKVGIIIADTKFEFGLDPDGNLLLVDEVLTPDSSRFWPEREWFAATRTGKTPPSFDKQPIRDEGKKAGVKENPTWVPPQELIELTKGNYQKIGDLLRTAAI